MERFNMPVYVPSREHFASERVVIPTLDENGEWVRIVDVMKLLSQLNNIINDPDITRILDGAL
jgi:hypothetical protein